MDNRRQILVLNVSVSLVLAQSTKVYIPTQLGELKICITITTIYKRLRVGRTLPQKLYHVQL